MQHDNTRYQKAVRRNVDELNNSILKRRALIGLHSAKSSHSLDFFMIAADALFNDIVAHAILVLDENSKSASFWYVYRCNEPLVNRFAKQRDISIEKLRELSKRFKVIRDETHFHIDRDGVLNPSEVWSRASVTGNELGWALQATYDILADIQETFTGARPSLPDYDGSDAGDIIRAYKAQNPSAKIFV
jgi:hypothetical protein